MSKKKQNQIKISFLGENSHQVTGSMILIETNTKKILLECGLFQSNNLKRDFEINTRKFKFKPKEIDYVFLNHAHIDHTGLTPRLYAEGCKATIIAVKDTKQLLTPLLKDSAFIMQRDVEALSRQTGKELKPIYESDHVDKCLDSFKEFTFNELHTIDDELSFEFVPSGHILRASQLILYIKQGNTTKKILYTSDIGNIQVEKYYAEPFEKVKNANIVIGECTYASNKRSVTSKDRTKDLEKIKSVVEETCIQNKGRVLIPIFSLDRTQNILTHLYMLFGEDENFTVPIILDSPLSCKITEIYGNILEGEDKELFDKVMSWKNLKLIKESDDSKACVADTSAKVILSSSGMMVSGRVKHYLKSIISDSKSTILFVGFASEGSLAWKIKNCPEQKTITIDKKPYRNRCNIVDLKSFTSHMQYIDLLAYYSEVNCEKICLVHSNFDEKVEFTKALQDEIERKNKSSKVVCVNQSTVINL